MKRSFHNGFYDLDEEPKQQKGFHIDRVRNAQKIRIMQLKSWSQYDKVKEKEEMSKLKKGLPLTKKGRKSVRFPQNLILLQAGNHGDTEEMRRLLSEGLCADVADTDGLTALHQCAINQNIDMCRVLINYKANVNVKDKEMWTPLHIAAIYGHTEICLLLIRSGANLMALNNEGNMPYDICKHEITLDAIENEMEAQQITQEMINEARLVPERQIMNDLQTFVAKNGVSCAVAILSQLDKQGANLVHVAAANGFSQVTTYLISLSVPLNLVDKDGWQAIHIAALFNQLAIIEILLSHGVNIEAQTKQGETVFELVCDKEMHEKLVLLKGEMETMKDNATRISSLGLVRRCSSVNPRSASIRRTSMKDKSYLSWKEARQEAELRLTVENEGDGDNVNSRSPLKEGASVRLKHRLMPETIVEGDYNEICLDQDGIAPVMIRPLSSTINKDLRDSFTHSHPYNSPTRDPDTFPYTPSLTHNATKITSKSPPEPMPRIRNAEKVAATGANGTQSSTLRSSQDNLNIRPMSLASTIPSRPQSDSLKVPSGPRQGSATSLHSSSIHTTPIGSARSCSQTSIPRAPRPAPRKHIATRYKSVPKPKSCCQIL